LLLVKINKPGIQHDISEGITSALTVYRNIFDRQSERITHQLKVGWSENRYVVKKNTEYLSFASLRIFVFK
jgi:hypothetical protein